MKKQFQKPCYHFEVSLRSQQMLENFIEANQRQMQALMEEINRVGNIAINNNQHLHIISRRTWKGLRKFYSSKSLAKAHYFKEYPHLHRTFTRDSRVDRPTPKLPPLHKIDEALFVNEPEPIAPETFSDGDSVTSNPENLSDDSEVNLLAPAGDDYVSPTSEEESSSDQSSSSESSSKGSPSRAPRVTATA